MTNSKIITWVISIGCVIFTVGALVNLFMKPTIPETNSVMNLTQFEKPEQLGAVVFRRFWVEIQEHPITVLGVSAEFQQYQKYLDGFYRVAEQNKTHFDSVFVADDIPVPGSLGPIQKYDLAEINQQLSLKKKILVVAISLDDKLNALRKDLPLSFIIAQGHLPKGESELASAKRACENSPLACQSIEATHAGKLRNPKENQITAAILHEAQYEALFMR